MSALHALCVPHVRSLQDEVRPLYPRVRVKYFLQRKRHSSVFILKIQRKKKHSNPYQFQTVNILYCKVSKVHDIYVLKRVIEVGIEISYKIYMKNC